LRAEFIPAGVFTLLGIRSVFHWASRPFDSEDPVDHLLYALYVAGRAGLWFAFAGLFAIYGVTGGAGQGFVDSANDYRWYVMVFAGLGALQFVAGWFLGRRQDTRAAPGDDGDLNRRL
jgi:hypothetical protein